MNRRMFIRGASATLWLPFLPSALPREARAATPVVPRRAAWWFIPNGFMPEFVDPSIVGENYDLPAAIAPVAKLQSRISVLAGLQNKAVDGFPAHEEAMPTLLGDNNVDNAYSTQPLDGGVTVDQFAAQAIGSATPFGSLQLGTDEPYVSGGAGSNLDTLYRTLSYATPTTPISPLGDPKTVFDRMFAGVDSGLTEAEIEARTELRRSLLDSVLDRVTTLESRLNAADKQKLDQFTTGVRELELQIEGLSELECPTPTEPNANPGLAEKIQAMIDLMVVAFQCDYTRIQTMMTGVSTSESVYSFLGISTTHHNLSHGWFGNAAQTADLKTIYNYNVDCFTQLATKLAAIPTDDGLDLLSNTMIFLVSEFGESNLHQAEPLTYLLAGGEAGGVVQGKHRRFGNAPHSNAWISALDFLQIDPTGYGTTWTGPLDLSS